MNRGEIWWGEDPTGQRRPYLVLSRQAAIGALHSVIAVPATRTVRGIFTEVALDRDDGMPEACALSFDNLTLITKYLLTDRICVLSPQRMREVCAALSVAVDC